MSMTMEDREREDLYRRLGSLLYHRLDHSMCETLLEAQRTGLSTTWLQKIAQDLLEPQKAESTADIQKALMQLPFIECIKQADWMLLNRAIGKGTSKEMLLRTARNLILQERLRQACSQNKPPDRTTTEENTDMHTSRTRTLNMSAIVALALAGTTTSAADEFSNLKGAFAKAAERRKAAAEEEAVEVIEKLMTDSEVLKTHLVRDIRGFRENERQMKNKLDALDTAKAYARVTSNFVPWAALLGHSAYSLGITDSEFEQLARIPVGWEPPE